MARMLSSPRSSARSARPRRRSRVPRKRVRGPRASARAPARQREVQAFLERFTVCLTSGDGDGATHCFELPALLVMADPRSGQSQVLQDPQKVAGFFTQAPEQYQQRGIETTFPEIESLQWIEDNLALVHVRFPYVDAQGNDLGDSESSLYVLRRDANGEYAIVTAIALGTESDRVARRKGDKPKPAGTEGDQLA